MSAPHPLAWPVAPLVSLVLLGGLWTERRLFRLPAGDADLYHARIRAAADQMPYRVGPWVGRDRTVPPAAVALLKPNVLLGRRFSNPATNEAADLLIVQCRDARDMVGHHPPRCYPAHGWTLREAEERAIVVGETTIPTTVYRFTFESVDRFSEMIVYSFFAGPNGVLASGRDGILENAEDPRARPVGAAQVQVVFGPAMGEDRRGEAFAALVSGAMPVLDAIRAGGGR